MSGSGWGCAVPRVTAADAYRRALALEDTAGADAAIAHYERALALDPDFAEAHDNVDGLYEQSGRGADALRRYRTYKQALRARSEAARSLRHLSAGSESRGVAPRTGPPGGA